MGQYEDMAKNIGLSPLYTDMGRKIDLFGHSEVDEIYNMLLDKASTRAGVPTENIEELMNIVAFHETGQTMDPTLIHNNAGRGWFGYEIGEESDINDEYMNASGSGRTAMNRLYSQIGGRLTTDIPGKTPNSIPKFMQEYFSGTNASGDVDVSTLTEKEQKLLFLADHLESGDFDEMGRYYITRGDISRWWGGYHKRAGTPDYDVFDANMKEYNRDKINR